MQISFLADHGLLACLRWALCPRTFGLTTTTRNSSTTRNSNLGACLYFGEAGNKHAGLYLCVNGNVRDWKARYAGAVNVLEFDGHYQCLLKKGDLVDIRAKRIFTDNPNIDLKLYNDREWDYAPYLRLTKVFAE